MTQYAAIPKASAAVVVVATGTALISLLQVATPATTNIKVLGWGVSFDGVAAADPPGILELIDVDDAATVTALSPELWGSGFAQASLCVSGTTATGFNASDEGTVTASRMLDPQHVHPQTGYSVWFPERAQPRVQVSRFLRIRALFSVDINAIPWVVWEEPA